MADLKAIEDKIRNINLDQPVEALKKFMHIRPINCKDIKLVEKDLNAFQNIVSKINEKDFTNLAGSFSRSQAEMCLDYLHRFMETIMSSQTVNSSGNMLKLEEAILQAYGPSILLTACQREDTIVQRRMLY